MFALALAILVAADVPFDAGTLERALLLRTPTLPTCVITVARVPAGLHATCDDRAITLTLPPDPTDAARATALALLAIADPAISLPTPEPEPVLSLSSPPPASPPPASPPPASRLAASPPPASSPPTSLWSLALGPAALAGLGPDDRALFGPRLDLDRRASRWSLGISASRLSRPGADTTPTLTATTATLSLSRSLLASTLDLGLLARAGVVDLSGATDGRRTLASTGVRLAYRAHLHHTLALAVIAEPTVALQRLSVEATGTGAVLATTPRVGVDVGVLLAWSLSP